MIFLRHLFGVVASTLRYSVAARRATLAVLVLLGLIAVALAVTGQVTAPLVLYPFA